MVPFRILITHVAIVKEMGKKVEEKKRDFERSKAKIRSVIEQAKKGLYPPILPTANRTDKGNETKEQEKNLSKLKFELDREDFAAVINKLS